MTEIKIQETVDWARTTRAMDDVPDSLRLRALAITEASELVHMIAQNADFGYIAQQIQELAALVPGLYYDQVASYLLGGPESVEV